MTVRSRTPEEKLLPEVQGSPAPTKRIPRVETPFGVRWALRLLAAALLFKVASNNLVADPDMFHEMALFREMLQAGSVPHDDVFAYTSTVSPVVHHEWATGAVLYAVAVSTGWGAAGLLLLRYILLAVIAVLCYACARRRGAGESLLVLAAGLAVVLLSPGLSPVRAHMFTFLAIAALLLLLESDQRGERWWLVVWLPLYLMWLNLHGGFVVGAVLFAVYTLECWVRSWMANDWRAAFQQTWHLFAAGIAMAVLPLSNPYGWRYIPYLWSALRLDRPLIAEWAPLWDPRVERALVVVYIASWLLTLYAVVRVHDIRRLPGLAMLVVTGLFALQHQRMLAIYGIVWFCYVPAFLRPTPLNLLTERLVRRHTYAVTVLAVLCGGAIVSLAAAQRPWKLRIPTISGDHLPVYPAGAVEYLAQQRFSGNVMTPFNVGAFVSWKLYPSVKVGMDSRYEVAYPPGAAQENFEFYAGQAGWRETLARYPTDAVLVPRESPLDSLLTQAPEQNTWSRVYRDDGYSLFASKAVTNLPFVDRTGQPVRATLP